MARKPKRTLDDIEAHLETGQDCLAQSYAELKGVSIEEAEKDIAEMSRSDDNDKLAQVYSRIAEALEDAGAVITKEILEDYIPGVVLDLAVDLDVIDHPEPGDCWIGPYFMVTQEFKEAFLEALPIDWFTKTPDWIHPTPNQIIDKFLCEKEWVLSDFIRALMTDADLRNGISWQDSKQRKWFDFIMAEPQFAVPQRVTAQRREIARYIGENSEKYHSLDPVRLTWRSR